MAPNLHLFSSPDKDDIRYIIEASRPYLEGKPDATVACLPLASLYVERWQEFTAESFKGLAQIETINAEMMRLIQIEDIIRRASLVYIPGGNTFLLNHRLHDPGVTVPLVHCRIGGKTIEVPVPVHIPDPDALPAGEDDIQRLVVVSAVSLFQANVFMAVHRSPFQQ